MLAHIASRRPWRLSDRAYPRYGTRAVIVRAAARRHASADNSSSTRWSLTGGEIACTMKTSFSRTGSLRRTDISPSGNRSTVHCPSGTFSSLAMTFASFGFAVPANKLNGFIIVSAITVPANYASPSEREVIKIVGTIGLSLQDAADN